MNLLTDPWLPAIRQDGQQERIAPWQIAEIDNPIIELAAPRADFQGALYQFLIGLLQSCFAPDGEEDWRDYWFDPPVVAVLQEQLQAYSGSFELLADDGPAFLQDFDLPEGEKKSVAALLIEAPGGKTIKDNLDHFVKAGTVNHICPSCAAMALYTLQTNAPSGGVGHRVGLRGGGPLTTLLLPQGNEASLWQKLWLNVLPAEELVDRAQGDDAQVFPWLVATRLSDNGGCTTEPGDVSPLQMYWGMPRRIRFELSEIQQGHCDLCGSQSEQLLSHYRTKNYGINYDGPWQHPLTPYRHDLKHQSPPLSLKGQQGGLGYRHWLGLLWRDEVNGDQACQVVKHYNQQRHDQTAQLWCFGYDMDNMKARCWYEHQLPVLKIAEACLDDILNHIGLLLSIAKDVATLLRTQVKAAWFERPKDAKGDFSMVDQSFWQATEYSFYQQLNFMAANPETCRYLPGIVAAAWKKQMCQSAVDLFDQWALDGEAEDMDMKRIVTARNVLKAKLKSHKGLKKLAEHAKAETEGVAE